jgi:lysylphosphatidylglycerol synthetase-like protein (DUF2156 family)
MKRPSGRSLAVLVIGMALLAITVGIELAASRVTLAALIVFLLGLVCSCVASWINLYDQRRARQRGPLQHDPR